MQNNGSKFTYDPQYISSGIVHAMNQVLLRDMKNEEKNSFILNCAAVGLTTLSFVSTIKSGNVVYSATLIIPGVIKYLNPPKSFTNQMSALERLKKARMNRIGKEIFDTEEQEWEWYADMLDEKEGGYLKGEPTIPFEVKQSSIPKNSQEETRELERIMKDYPELFDRTLGNSVINFIRIGREVQNNKPITYWY